MWIKPDTGCPTLFCPPEYKHIFNRVQKESSMKELRALPAGVLLLGFLGLAASAETLPNIPHRAPDYSSVNDWILRPDTADKPFDVFFVHPTTYGATNLGMNAPVDDPEIRRVTEETTPQSSIGVQGTLQHLCPLLPADVHCRAQPARGRQKSLFRHWGCRMSATRSPTTWNTTTTAAPFSWPATARDRICCMGYSTGIGTLSLKINWLRPI